MYQLLNRFSIQWTGKNLYMFTRECQGRACILQEKTKKLVIKQKENRGKCTRLSTLTKQTGDRVNKRPEVVLNLSTSVASVTRALITKIGTLNGTETYIGSG